MTDSTASECDLVRDELSASMDGEADDPHRVEAHLDACPACFERLRQMTALSMVIKELPAPDLDDHFTILIAQRLQPRFSRKFWPAASALLAAAASIVLVSAVVLSMRQPASIVTTRAPNLPAAPETGFVAEIMLGNETPPWDFGFPVPGDAPEVNSNDLVLALSSSGWFEDAAQQWEAETDIEDLVQSLDDNEKTEFKRLLRTYQEGAQI